ADLIKVISPNGFYVGELGTGMKLKFVTNLVACINGAAVVEGMAFAQTLGLDLGQVAKIVAASPGATSGQFQLRAPLIADGEFDGELASLAVMTEMVRQIAEAADEFEAQTPTLSAVKAAYEEFAQHVDPLTTGPSQMFHHLQGHPVAS
ncbi:MAG: hypothetical protein QOF68_3088, partial [Gaiellales bacterium]|nr:hypothetical protein [Gaiellales bacterium]